MEKAGRGLHRRWSVWASMIFLLSAGLLAILAPALPLQDPYVQISQARLEPPSWRHPLGTDDIGRDMLSRILHGGRYSLSAGFVAVGLAFVIGVPAGIVAGYSGGWTDRILVGLIEIVMGVPGILLALVLIAVLGPSLFNVMLAVGIAQIPHFARQARASAMAVKELDFVAAAHVSGSTTPVILWRHILPNAMAPVLVVATMGLGSAILDAAALSFLGLSGDPSRPEWGAMLTANRERFITQPWTVIAPGVAITASVLSFNILGDALRDRWDVRKG